VARSGVFAWPGSDLATDSTMISAPGKRCSINAPDRVHQCTEGRDIAQSSTINQVVEQPRHGCVCKARQGFVALDDIEHAVEHADHGRPLGQAPAASSGFHSHRLQRRTDARRCVHQARTRVPALRAGSLIQIELNRPRIITRPGNRVAGFVLQQQPAPFVNVFVQRSSSRKVVRQTCRLALGQIGRQPVLEPPDSLRVALEPLDDCAIRDLLESQIPWVSRLIIANTTSTKTFNSASSGC